MSVRPVLSRRARLAACGVLMWAASLFAAVPQPVPTRHVIHRAAAGEWTLVVTAPTNAAGLHGAVLAATGRDRAVQVPLDTTPTARMARGIDAIRLHAASGRLLVLVDQAHDSPGLLVIDLHTGTVVEAAIGRYMSVSPDARYVAFEEYAVPFDTPWPWNETVYAVLDVTLPAERMRRTCPFEDDRCRGVLIHLPSRQEVCAGYRERGGLASCLRPGVEPQHERRSPFVWLDAGVLAFVSVDHSREQTVVVTAAFDGGDAPSVRRYECPLTPDGRGARCPPTRTAWQVDGIRRDDADGQLWIHFRDRLPEVPGGWLGVGRL